MAIKPNVISKIHNDGGKVELKWRQSGGKVEENRRKTGGKPEASEKSEANRRHLIKKIGGKWRQSGGIIKIEVNRRQRGGIRKRGWR
jgi:hypothetical protein